MKMVLGMPVCFAKVSFSWRFFPEVSSGIFLAAQSLLPLLLPPAPFMTWIMSSSLAFAKAPGVSAVWTDPMVFKTFSVVFFKQEEREGLSLSLRTPGLLVIRLISAEWPVTAAMLCPSFGTFLIIASSALNSGGDNEAQIRVSAELQRGNAFLSHATEPYLCVCGDLGSCSNVLLIFTELKRGETCRAG